MKKIFLTVNILAVIIQLAHSGDFTYSTIDLPGFYGEMVVAPARNDGINRLYATGSSIYEYTWQDSVWHRDTVQESPPVIDVITAGFGRNDSVWRLYAGDGGDGLYEYTYNGGTWDRVQIESVTEVGGSIAIGDIKNDDTLRVVAGGGDGVVMAYTYQTVGNIWIAETLGLNTNAITSVDIGKGRNDDTNRVYAGGGNTAFVEYWHNGSGWNIDTVYAGVRDADIGAGRNENIVRIYCAGIVEKTWEFNVWQYNTLDTNLSVYGGRSVLADGRNDDMNRLYVTPFLSTSLGGDQYEIYVLEKSYDSTTGWIRKEMPAITSCFLYPTMEFITSGQGRNDGLTRIYSCASSGELYEWTWVDSINGVTAEPITCDRVFSLQLNQNYPNPFKQSTVIRYQATGDGPVKIAVYNIAGQLVRDLTPSPLQMNLERGVREGSITWDGRDYRGKPVNNGLYFYCLEAGGIRQTKKMILLK